VFFLAFLGVCAFVVFLILGGLGQGMLGRHEKIVDQRPGRDIRSATSALNAEDLARLDNTVFALRLARGARLGAGRGNACLSPYGVQIPLLMLLNGSQSTTFETLSSVLVSKDPTTEKHNAAQSKLLDVFSSQPRAKVKVANALWAVQPLRFKKLFQDDMAKTFDAEVRKLGSAGDGALKQVNDWVDQRTEGRIKRLFDRLSPDVALVLVDVLVLDARWSTPFAPASDRAFRTPDGEKPVASLWDGARVFRAAGEAGYSAATLGYEGSTLEATFVLPDRSGPGVGTDEFWKGLEGGRLQRLVKGKDVEGTFQIPKFSFRTNVDVRRSLTSIGAGGLFKGGNDFSLLMHDSVFDRVDQFVQRTVVAFDEEGTRAAAATGMDGAKSAPGEATFVADRPFAFFVRETTSGCILFVGVVNDPTKP